MTLKTRFCPSPTGQMHLGNARTALFNALVAKQAGGVFLLRIEDTDPERSRPEFTAALQTDLHWLGLPWQEGPGAEGAHGPYAQSQRQSHYDSAYQQLIEQDFAYPCFCSETDLVVQRKQQLSAGKPPRYAGTCTRLSAEQVAAYRAEGRPEALRFRVDPQARVVFTDGAKGEQVYYGRDMGDFIIRRTDGTAPFLFCNALDDALMQVTQVLRGEDHLTNTPRQLLLLQALGLPAPQYAHMALIVGDDGRPLAKRHGAQSIAALREQGYLPLALLNYLARLGHVYPIEQDALLLDEQALAQAFSCERLGRASARFDVQQLQYWQRQAVAALSPEAAWQWLAPSVQTWVSQAEAADFVALVQPNIHLPAEGANWATCLYTSWDWTADQRAILHAAGAEFFTQALTTLAEHGADYGAWLSALKAVSGLRGKALFMPIRLALTGREEGPALADLCAFIETVYGVAKRLQAALALVKASPVAVNPS